MRLMGMIEGALRRLVKPLPPSWRAVLRKRWNAAAGTPAATEYATRILEETSRFAGETVVNDLPPIFH